MSEGNKEFDIQTSQVSKMGQQKTLFHTGKTEMDQIKTEQLMLSQTKKNPDEQTVKKQGTLQLQTQDRNTNHLVLSQSGIHSQSSQSKLPVNNVFNLGGQEGEQQFEQHFGQPHNNGMNSSGETTKEIFKQIESNNNDINNFNTFNNNP